MTPIEQIKAEIERRLKNEHITFHARNELLNLLSFIESLEKDEAQIPELPDNLDEAAEEFAKRQGTELAPFAQKFFKAGAALVAGQGVEAYCIKSFNPVSESPDKLLHGIEIIYEEINGMPYVLAGDKIIIQIRKAE